MDFSSYRKNYTFKNFQKFQIIKFPNFGSPLSASKREISIKSVLSFISGRIIIDFFVKLPTVYCLTTDINSLFFIMTNFSNPKSMNKRMSDILLSNSVRFFLFCYFYLYLLWLNLFSFNRFVNLVLRVARYCLWRAVASFLCDILQAAKIFLWLYRQLAKLFEICLLLWCINGKWWK